MSPLIPPLSIVIALFAGCAPEPTGVSAPGEALYREGLSIEAQLREASRDAVSLRTRDGLVVSATMRIPAVGADPLAQAMAYLDAFGALYGVSDPDAELYPVSVTSDEDGDYVTLHRRSGDIPVLDGALVVHLLRGEVRSTLGQLSPKPGGGLAPTIDASRAPHLAVAAPSVRGGSALGAPSLGLAWSLQQDGSREMALVWRVLVIGTDAETGDLGTWRIDVDARSGAVISAVSEHEGAKDIRIASAEGSGYDLLSCWTFVDDVDWFDTNGPLDAYDPGDDAGGDGQIAWDLAHETWDFHDSAYGWSGWDNNNHELVAVVHANLTNTVASASSSCNTMQFEDGWVRRDIFFHEFTHQVDAHSANLTYNWLTGAMDEHFADMEGALADGQWDIGGFRSMSNPPIDGNPDHMLPFMSGDSMGLRPPSASDNGWVHVNSSIPNKAGWLVAVGGTHNGYTITPLDTLVVQRLWHKTHVTAMAGATNFDDLRDALVAKITFWADNSVYGLTEDDVCQVKNAFASVGVDTAGADWDCDQVSDGWDDDVDGDWADDDIDNCPGLPNINQTDTDGDGMGDACDLDLDGDGEANTQDNCILVPNSDQTDTDGDDIGDVCDDSDGDTIIDPEDNCVYTSNKEQTDTDSDGSGDACDTDDDNDGVIDTVDNCDFTVNPDQTDTDGDEVGDACDNCKLTPNPDQQDCDKNGKGSACDDPLEVLYCLDFASGWVEMHPWVHPLDLVSLPYIDLEQIRDATRLQVTVVTEAGLSAAVVDATGRVITRGNADREGRVTMTWTPDLGYSWRSPESLERSAWATSYSVQFEPSDALLDGFEAQIEVEAVQ